MTTVELWLEIISAAGAKKLAAALGRNLSRVYRWAEGENGPLDWFETTVELLAVRPKGRPVLIRLQHWTESLFRRSLQGSQASPMSTAELRARACRLLRETADVIEACGHDVNQIDRDLLVKDALEVRDLIDQVISAAEAGFVEEGAPRPRAVR